MDTDAHGSESDAAKENITAGRMCLRRLQNLAIRGSGRRRSRTEGLRYGCRRLFHVGGERFAVFLADPADGSGDADGGHHSGGGIEYRRCDAAEPDLVLLVIGGEAQAPDL